jgi:hypothetical protein
VLETVEEAELVIDEDAVDVSVVDGDEISQPKKVPDDCLEMISFKPAASREHEVWLDGSIIMTPPKRHFMALVNFSPAKFLFDSGNCVISRRASTIDATVPTQSC